MNRRKFLAAAAASAAVARGDEKILLPTDDPDRYGFRIMWYNPPTPIDKANYTLQVGGLVEQPQQFSVEHLSGYSQVEQNSRMKCVQCWSGRATWGGFRFGELLEDVKPSPKAKAIRLDCHDKWYEYMSLEEMASPRVLLALRMAGTPLTDQHGAPLRLIDPARYGYKSCKLITKITFVEEGKGSMACDIGPYYSPDGRILPGYDHPLDIGKDVRRRIKGGEITDY
ncbi:MAG: molybdopterin-dependent oxidoreductase [Acidobacteria bacterium]|nr:molybdopterin-dependent oxidoreductase [Acidobacteriota bacterium]